MNYDKTDIPATYDKARALTAATRALPHTVYCKQLDGRDRYGDTSSWSGYG
jgi:hypothetical protein